MNCPKCHIALDTKSIKGVVVDECSRCEGIWCTSAELKLIKDKTDSDLNWMDFEIWKHPERFKAKTTRSSCPNCQNPMDVLDYDDTEVEIDYCSRCKSVWLDKNELEKIIDALKHEILSKSTGDYVKETIEEAKDLIAGSDSFLSEWKDFSTILRFLQYRILSLHTKIRNTLVSFQENPFNR